jgi:endo-1,4-beta-xylanase
MRGGKSRSLPTLASLASGQAAALVMTTAGCIRLAALTLAITTLACGSSVSDVDTTPTGPLTPVADTTSLRTYATRRNLSFGAAIDRGFRYAGTDGTNFKNTFTRQFNMLVAENDMKHDRIHPARDTYRFAPADSLVAFAEQNGMKVRGHTLVFHNQNASWLTSGTWTKEQARQLLIDHITNVVAHYRGRIMEWDVVNEMLGDNGALRPGFYLNTIGPEYIELAFRTARAADPSVGLYYNDYNIEGVSAKSDSAYKLVKDLVDRGVPITGVGFESHFIAGQLPANIDANMQRFAALGLKVHITELDIRVPVPSSSAALQTQAQNYRDYLAACLRFPACDVVVLWGFTDKESWIPSTFPGFGDALIFDSFYQPKPAFTSIQAVLK